MFLMCFVECHMLISIVLSLDVTSRVLSLACFALSLNMIQKYVDFFKIVHIILKTWGPGNHIFPISCFSYACSVPTLIGYPKFGNFL